jgi:hypothetical protein
LKRPHTWVCLKIWYPWFHWTILPLEMAIGHPWASQMSSCLGSFPFGGFLSWTKLQKCCHCLLQHLQLACLSKRDSAPESGHDHICYATMLRWSLKHFGAFGTQFWQFSPWGQHFICGSAFALIISWTHSIWPVLRMQTSTQHVKQKTGLKEKLQNETAQWSCQ